MPTNSIPELRLARVETLFAKRQWRAVHQFLTPQDRRQSEEGGGSQPPEELPPSLAVFRALARIEGNIPGRDGEPTAVEELIRSMEGLLGVPSGNPLALLLAKRLIRRPPVTKRKTSWKVSAVSIAVALIVGLSAGWALFTYAPQLIVLEAQRAK